MNEIYRFESVKKYYLASRRGLLEMALRKKPVYVHALEDFSFSLETGKVTAMVGESGSGKTTIGKIMATIENPTSGSVYFKGTKVSSKDYPRIRKDLSMVFQNPATSLNPRMRISELMSEPLGNFDKDKVEESLQSVGLSFDEVRNKQPKELSGGQIQRIAIARALVKHPDLIILDEPTSALDESMQAQILNILIDIQEQFHLTYIFITHNISVAKYLADTISVLYAGKLVENGPAQKILSAPQHPYTQLLIKSVPTVSSREISAPTGDVPSLINPPTGCRFHTRCPFVMEKCRQEEPPLVVRDEVEVACWLDA